MLSQLVNYYNTLCEIPINEIMLRADKDFTTVAADAGRTDKTWAALQHLSQHRVLLDQHMQQIATDLEDLKREVKQEIDLIGRGYFLDSYERYDAMRTDTVDYILNRQIPADVETENILIARIQSLSDWRFPGMIFRPGRRNYIRHMVALDPLYVIDTDYDLLRPALEHFSEPYRSRLRPVVIDEDRDTIIQHVPQGQIGTIFALDFFEYRPLEMIRRYFTEFDYLLRPGGSVLISYNNCDLAHGVRQCETKTRCFTPGGMIRDLLESINFEIVSSQDRMSSFSWIEFRKPGQLRSLRGGQSLAKIIDKIPGDPYNKQYRRFSEQELRQEGLRLNISNALTMNPDELTRMIYNLHKGNQT